jgi:hypothetical protein
VQQLHDQNPLNVLDTDFGTGLIEAVLGQIDAGFQRSDTRQQLFA